MIYDKTHVAKVNKSEKFYFYSILFVFIYDL